MENLKVDNEHLNDLAKFTERLISEFQKDVALLKDDKADIFDRYMAFNRCATLANFIEPIKKSLIASMIGGHNLQNKIFHTESGKKNGWDNPKPDDHPFFENECNHEHHEMPDILGKIIGGAILSSILKKRKNDATN